MPKQKEKKSVKATPKATISSPKELKQLSEEIHTLHEKIDAMSKLRVVRTYSSQWRWFFFNLNAGIAKGLGTVLGATFFLGIVMYFISRIALVPVLGNLVTDVIDYINDYANLDIKY